MSTEQFGDMRTEYSKALVAVGRRGSKCCGSRS